MPYATAEEYEAVMRRNKSPGACPKCNPSCYQEEEWGHKSKNCRNIKFCWFHGVEGHTPTLKCVQFCINCKNWGHSMHHCHKLKHCNLCGKFGHNPYKCWTYGTIDTWLMRARDDDRCVNCLRPWKTRGDRTDCSSCGGRRGKDCFPSQSPQETKESQTEENIHLGQEYQAELQQAKAIIEDQRIQIEELNSKISTLEVKLKSSIATIKESNSQWQYTVQEKVAELRKLCEQIGQKDFELDQQRKASAQSSQPVPATPDPAHR